MLTSTVCDSCCTNISRVHSSGRTSSRWMPCPRCGHVRKAINPPSNMCGFICSSSGHSFPVSTATVQFHALGTDPDPQEHTPGWMQETELLAAGFPCVDVSRQGLRRGMDGKVTPHPPPGRPRRALGASCAGCMDLPISFRLQGTALIRQVFRLLETAKRRQHTIPCVLLENVRRHPLSGKRHATLDVLSRKWSCVRRLGSIVPGAIRYK